MAESSDDAAPLILGRHGGLTTPDGWPPWWPLEADLTPPGWDAPEAPEEFPLTLGDLLFLRLVVRGLAGAGHLPGPTKFRKVSGGELEAVDLLALEHELAFHGPLYFELGVPHPPVDPGGWPVWRKRVAEMVFRERNAWVPFLRRSLEQPGKAWSREWTLARLFRERYQEHVAPRWVDLDEDAPLWAERLLATAHGRRAAYRPGVKRSLAVARPLPRRENLGSLKPEDALKYERLERQEAEVGASVMAHAERGILAQRDGRLTVDLGRVLDFMRPGLNRDARARSETHEGTMESVIEARPPEPTTLPQDTREGRAQEKARAKRERALRGSDRASACRADRKGEDPDSAGIHAERAAFVARALQAVRKVAQSRARALPSRAKHVRAARDYLVAILSGWSGLREVARAEACSPGNLSVAVNAEIRALAADPALAWIGERLTG